MLAAMACTSPVDGLAAVDQSRSFGSVTANVYYLQKLPIAFFKSRYYA
jgi:hypothetical protein